jgi:aspartyl-tRNA(Asn)/glutamyl-tRNA(Gln) amidotransferase subunit C
MIVDRRIVEHVAALAKLKPGENETTNLADEMTKILGYVEMISELNPRDIEPTSHASAIECPMREDTSRPGLTADLALSNAPDRAADFVRVPAIIE